VLFEPLTDPNTHVKVGDDGVAVDSRPIACLALYVITDIERTKDSQGNVNEEDDADAAADFSADR
jgi:hypothetical protein